MTQNLTSTYTPTFLEKLLGRNYKWWFLTFYEFKRSGASGFGDFVFQVQLFLSNGMWLYVWSLSSLSSFVYLATGRVLAYLTNNFWQQRIGSYIVDGRISNVLLRPGGVFIHFFFECLGGRLFRNMLSTATILLVLVLFSLSDLEVDYTNLNYWIILYAPILYCMNFVWGFLVSSIAFFIKDKRDFSSLLEAIQSILNIFSGLLIPLNKLPFLSGFFIHLPFSLVFYHPTNILTNQYNLQQTLYVFAAAIIWVVFLYFLGGFVFKLGLKRNEAVGL